MRIFIFFSDEKIFYSDVEFTEFLKKEIGKCISKIKTLVPYIEIMYFDI